MSMTIASTTLEGTGTTLTDADIDNLRRSVRGELVVAAEGGVRSEEPVPHQREYRSVSI